MSNPPDPSAPLPSTPDVPSVRAEIRRIADLVNDAREIISHGTLVPLNGLEVLIRSACAMAAGLPKEQGRQLRSDLEALVYDLDALETDMADRFGTLARRLGDDGPRPPTVGAAYQAGVKRAAQIERQRAKPPAVPPKPQDRER